MLDPNETKTAATIANKTISMLWLFTLFWTITRVEGLGW